MSAYTRTDEMTGMQHMAMRNAYADCSAGQNHYRHVDGPATGSDIPLVFFQQTASSSAMSEHVMAGLAGAHPAAFVQRLERPSSRARISNPTSMRGARQRRSSRFYGRWTAAHTGVAGEAQSVQVSTWMDDRPASPPTWITFPFQQAVRSRRAPIRMSHSSSVPTVMRRNRSILGCAK